ncbi:MAG: hypothetical protein HC802_02545 [Caldilineaceae bacterium]|nr:hypothetical protein [Caldilineaceae bacterium]
MSKANERRKQTRLLEAILQELRSATTELRLLRNELERQPTFQNFDEKYSDSQPTQDAKPEDETKKDALAVYDWLTAKGITVRNYHERNAADIVYDQMARFLGERFGNVSRVYEYIKRSLSTGKSFSLNLASSSQNEIADSTQFCDMLSKHAFLASYNYNKKSKTIYANPQRDGKVINFVNGGWFERYAHLSVCTLLKRQNLAYTCLFNPQISFQNGDDFELDLIFLIDNQPLWLECKTGEYAAYITKYSDVRKVLSVPKERAILILLGIEDELTINLTHLYGMTVANEHSFLEKVSVALGITKQIEEKETVKIIAPISGPTSLSTVLNKADVRPVPEYRQQAIVELIAMFKSSNQPITPIELKAALAERIGASRSQVQDILNAMVRSGCFLDGDGQSMLSLSASVAKLVSNNSSIIERKCIESYVRAVLLVTSGYFDSPANIAEFERVVGGTAPDKATIDALDETLGV